MRLICPNCSAQYEVPDDVMPAEGRDVQCSNCGTTWFQDHPDTIAEREAGHAPSSDEVSDRGPDAHAKPEAEPEPEPEAEAETEEESESPPSEPAAVTAMTTEPAPAMEEPEEAQSRRRLAPEVADVLREEAERESTARQSEAGTLESQPELGLPEASPDKMQRTREAQDRMARMRGEAGDADQSDSEQNSIGARKDLLPDIEEINSTLRSNSSRSPDGDPGQTAQVEVQEKRSSRRGFVLTVALVAVMALVYSYAPQIAGALPSAEPALAGYVAMIDGWRIWMDEQLSSLLTWLDAAAVSSAQ